MRPDIPTKTGLMVGLGEEHDELVATFRDLRDVGCGILTIGQYLRPTGAARADGPLLPSRRVPRAQSRSRSIWASSTSNPARWCAARTTPTKPRTLTSALRRRAAGSFGQLARR